MKSSIVESKPWQQYSDEKERIVDLKNSYCLFLCCVTKLPRLFSPECAPGGTEVVEVGNFFHAEPAELGPADCAGHVVA